MKKAFSAEQTSLDTRSSTVELRTSSEVCTTVYIQLGKKNPLRKWRLNGYMWSREKIKKGGFLGTLIKSQIMLLASSRLSLHPYAWNNSAPTGRIFKKFGI